ncbi:NAD+ synthase (glutamine-hydrolyzing) [Natronospira proteinivora]|uniref:Glutamine-dependent NAD(+) synthetase n=1 Tax=Natronospira proteinivora TaxID=1807133 RepID=A0ABT1GAZ0_9GAMM|nr:NAD+ synthase [Natronospira proteinivora]MCP1727488.1 NAD+ synthase (glutamine-hydrolyzing) [Natronospira proteinivora]
MSAQLVIVTVQINPVVGDIQGNLDRMLEAVSTARQEHGADLVIFPEFCLTGYPPEDLLLHEDFSQQVQAAEATLRAKLPGDVGVLYGTPDYSHEGLRNAAVLLSEGRELARYHKRCLPNYSVFDEKRWFTAGDQACVVDFKGVKLGLTICEDLWVAGPAEDTGQAGAELILSLSASPYALNKAEERQAEFAQRAREGGVPVLVCNLLGGQDELVFDGASVGVNPDGAVALQAPEWQAGFYPVQYAQGRLFDGPVHTPLSAEASQYQGAVLATRDYLNKNGAPGALIGLSGGIDSAITLAIAVDAIGADRVTAVMMGSAYTRDISYELAREQAALLDVEYLNLDIGDSVAALEESLSRGLAEPVSGVAAENLQSRIRGVKLMALSNQRGEMVLATGNKSELAMGYATLYGDMVGAFAPIRDLSKSRVYALADWRNRQGRVIPQAVIDRPPSAELRPDQYDTDSLPEYAVLDAIIEAFVEADRGLNSLVAEGFDEALCQRVLRMVQLNEYKRRQGAPGPRLSRRAFGRDRRYPITSGFRRG